MEEVEGNDGERQEEEQQERQRQQEDEGDEKNRLAVAAAQAVNFSVSAIASASTTLLACTNELPNSDGSGLTVSRLIVDATVQCYQGWQYLLMVFLALLVLVVSAPLMVEAFFRCFVGEAASEHALRYDAIRSVTALAWLR